MKHWSFVIAISIFIVQSCHVPTEKVVPDTSKQATTKNKVLLEIYTGVRCSSCPASTSKGLQYIKDRGFDKNIVPIHIHASEMFAAPLNKTSQDFRTNEGKSLSNQFEINSLPQAVISRRRLNNLYGISYSYWATAVEKVLSDPLYGKAEMLPTIDFDYSSRILNISTAIKLKEQFLVKTILSAYITEDSIIQAQLLDAVLVDNYIHMNVLRGKLNLWLPDVVKDRPPSVLEWTEKFISYQIPQSWLEKNCNLILVLSNEKNGEVMQVHSQKLMDKAQ